MQSYLNYTPHNIDVQLEDGTNVTIPSSGSARVTETRQSLQSHAGIPLQTTIYGHIEGLPEEKENIKIIVSMLVTQINKNSLFPRKDLVSPDTGRTCMRDEKGNVKAVRGFLV